MEIIYRLGDNGMQNSAIVFSFCAYSKVILVTLIPSTTWFFLLISIHFLEEPVEIRICFSHFHSADHFINSRNLFSWLSIDISGENWCWSFLGLKGLTLIDRLSCLPQQFSWKKHIGDGIKVKNTKRAFWKENFLLRHMYF